MATPRQARIEKRAEEEDPINFTCGKCKLAQPFQEDYACVNCDEEEAEEKENLEESE